MQEALSTSPAVLIGSWLVGAFGSILGGFVAAWLAKNRELVHAFSTGALSLTFGIVSILLLSLAPIPVSQPRWVTIIGPALTIPAAVLGGWLRQKAAGRTRRAG